MPQIKVPIVGAGLGGLCLAQALRKAHINVEVFERDASPWDRAQGYSLHLEVARWTRCGRCGHNETACGIPSRTAEPLR